MISITDSITLDEDELEFSFIRASGPGGQNVNKVSSAVHLRYDISTSSLAEAHKARLLALRDSRITTEGVVIIKAQRYRSQDMNRQDAVARLQALVDSVARPPRIRHATRPTLASQKRRIESKTRRGTIKASRRKPGYGKITAE